MIKVFCVRTNIYYRYIGSANDGMGFGSALPAVINIIIIAVGSNQEENI